jgi:hypothetical protein
MEHLLAGKIQIEEGATVVPLRAGDTSIGVIYLDRAHPGVHARNEPWLSITFLAEPLPARFSRQFRNSPADARRFGFFGEDDFVLELSHYPLH